MPDASRAHRAYEKALDRFDVAAVGKEQDHVVARLHDRVVMRHDHLLTAHHRADGRAFRQRDVAYRLADDPRAVLVALRDRLEGLGGSAAQGVHAHDLPAAYVREQRAYGDALRRDGHIDAAGLDEIGVGRLVDQRHDLVRAEALGQHRRQDVGLLRVGESAEDVGAVDVLLDQQFLVRGVAREHDRILELLRHPPRAPHIALDELHLARLLERAREAKAYVTAARNDHTAYPCVLLAQLADHPADVIARREEEHLIAFLDDRRAFRRYAAAAAVDGNHARFHAGQMLRQLPEAMTHQEPAADGTDPHQADLAGGEIQDLQRSGVADQPLDVFGDELLRADEDIDRNGLLAEELRPLGVLRRADSLDLGGRAEQGKGHLARHHVDFVAVGQCDDDLRLGRACRLEDRRVSRIADDGMDIEAVLQIAQHILVDIDDGDFVCFLSREVPGDGAANLSGAENEDLHSRRSALKPVRGWHIASSATWCPAARSLPVPARAGRSLRHSTRRPRRTCRAAPARRGASRAAAAPRSGT